MSRSFLLTLIMTVLFFNVSCRTFYKNQKLGQACNITHFQFRNNVSFSRGNQLNRTFTKLGQKITSLNKVSWKVNDSATYIITNGRPTFSYRGTKQKVEIIGNDTICFSQGYVDVVINFTWQKIGENSKVGIAQVKGLSDEIAFCKSIDIDEEGFFKYTLLEFLNPTFGNPLIFTRIEPPISPDEQNDLMKLVNNMMNVTTLKDNLEDEIALAFGYYLAMNLYDQFTSTNRKFFYEWVNPVPQKGEFVINFTRRLNIIDITKNGIFYGYEATIDGFPQAQCGKMPRAVPLNPRVYGGSQQFISLNFYQNVLKFAIKNGQMNTNLNRQNWESKYFQFYAGDLYEIFPKVAEVYKASNEVTGDCKANWKNTELYKGTADNTLNVTIFHNCQLSINKTKIVEFKIDLEVEVQGRPTANYMDFYAKSHTQFVSYFENFGFKLENKELADAIIRHSLDRLYENKLFGSGWTLYPKRDYPQYETDLIDAVVYDPSHVYVNMQQQ